MQSVIDAATVGLDISASRGEAALVPFYNNKERRYECMFMPMYKGLARLARNSGEIKRIEAEIVCTNDLFVYTKGTTIFVDWAPALDDRGEAIGAYALVEFTNGGVQATYLSKADIMKVKAFSKMSGKGPWVQWEYEMWKKTVFRNLSKWLSLNSERFHRAVEMSDHEYDLAAPPQTSEASDLNDRLQLNQAVDDADLPEFLTETTNEENHDGN